MHKIADAGYITLHRGSINIVCHLSATKIPVYVYLVF